MIEMSVEFEQIWGTFQQRRPF